MKLRSALPMKVAKYGTIAMALLLCGAGLAIILLPEPTEAAVGLFLGITMLLFGIIKLIGYFSRDLFRLAFQYDLQFGILLCLLGLVTLVKHEHAVSFICVAYGVSMIADGLFKARTAFEARRFGIRQWWLTLVFAIAAALAGLLISVWPAAALRMVRVLLGLSLLAEGALSLSVAVSMVKIIDHQQPDVIDAEFYEVWEEPNDAIFQGGGQAPHTDPDRDPAADDPVGAGHARHPGQL